MQTMSGSLIIVLSHMLYIYFYRVISILIALYYCCVQQMKLNAHVSKCDSDKCGQSSFEPSFKVASLIFGLAKFSIQFFKPHF